LRRFWLTLPLILATACFGGGSDGDPAPGPTDAPPARSDAPDSISIPSIDVDAPLTLRELVPGQPLSSPDGPYDVAIYDFGPQLRALGGAPGEGGNVVLAGENLGLVGCVGADPPCNAVFRDLRAVDPGAAVGLTWRGSVYTYQVVSMCNIPTALFDDGLYHRTTEEQLTLLTGAGAWSSESGWSHVLIVIAKPPPRTAIERCPEGAVAGRP
jgi:hypothetical protein